MEIFFLLLAGFVGSCRTRILARMSARLGCSLALELALASSLCSDTLARCTLGYNLSSHQLLVWFRIVFFWGEEGKLGEKNIYWICGSRGSHWVSSDRFCQFLAEMIALVV
jgi:hypothetical protein